MLFDIFYSNVSNYRNVFPPFIVFYDCNWPLDCWTSIITRTNFHAKLKEKEEGSIELLEKCNCWIRFKDRPVPSFPVVWNLASIIRIKERREPASVRGSASSQLLPHFTIDSSIAAVCRRFSVLASVKIGRWGMRWFTVETIDGEDDRPWSIREFPLTRAKSTTSQGSDEQPVIYSS